MGRGKGRPQRTTVTVRSHVAEVLPEARLQPLDFLVERARQFANAEEFLAYHYLGFIPSSAYEEKTYFMKRENYPELVVAMRVGRSTIEFRRSGEKLKYVAHDENGEILRDSEGWALYMSDDEVLANGWPLYDTTIAVFDGERNIGHVGDSFGATEVFIDPEYQRKGIGTEALLIYLRQYGYERRLGQMTAAGENLTRSLYRRLVKCSRREKASAARQEKALQ